MNVSVIIPTHNRGIQLTRALESVFAQSRPPTEVIVVDDGSLPVVTSSIFESAPSAISCVLLRHEQSLGANSARNSGAERSRGQLIAFLDDDDQWEQHKLEMQISAMEQTHADMCFTGKMICLVDGGGIAITVRYSYMQPRFSDLKKSIMHGNFVGTTSSVMFRKACFLELGGFNPDLPALQDYELYIRAAFNDCEIVGIDAPLTKYTVQENALSISGDLVKHARASWQIISLHGRKPFARRLVLALFIAAIKKLYRKARNSIRRLSCALLGQGI